MPIVPVDTVMANHIRIIVLGQEILEPATGAAVCLNEHTRDFVVWAYDTHASVEVQRITFEVACEKLWQLVHVGIPPRSRN